MAARPAPRPFVFPPLWREGRTGVEMAALLRDPVLRGQGVPEGDGRGVLLIPGFLAGDGSLAVMTAWLRRAGWRTKSAGTRANIDCSGESLARLAERLERLAERTGGPVTVIGQSRGGSLARALAVREPGLVSGVIVLGSPQMDPFAVHPLVLLQVRAVSALGSLGVPGLFRQACLDGACCAEFRDGLARRMPDGVGYVSVYSRTDGVVDWRSCLDPDAEHVEVDASHIGMAVNPGVYRAVAAAFARFDRGRAPAPAPAPAPA
jgi:triacylglycerol lipase